MSRIEYNTNDLRNSKTMTARGAAHHALRIEHRLIALLISKSNLPTYDVIYTLSAILYFTVMTPSVRQNVRTEQRTVCSIVHSTQ